LGQKRSGKKKHAGKEDGIFVHPQNGFNELILNWCIGGCWFTPAVLFKLGLVTPDGNANILKAKKQEAKTVTSLHAL
jgi:hypothetical protein